MYLEHNLYNSPKFGRKNKTFSLWLDWKCTRFSVSVSTRVRPLHLFGLSSKIHSFLPEKFREQTFATSLHLTHLVSNTKHAHPDCIKCGNITPYHPLLPSLKTDTRESSKLQSINIMWYAHGRYISRNAKKGNELEKVRALVCSFGPTDLWCWGAWRINWVGKW